jgi:hypothetical protein
MNVLYEHWSSGLDGPEELLAVDLDGPGEGVARDGSRGMDGPGAGVWTGREQGYRRARSRDIDGPGAGV